MIEDLSLRREDMVGVYSYTGYNDIRRFLMPARDMYHNAVKAALINDGWTVTHDPY